MIPRLIDDYNYLMSHFPFSIYFLHYSQDAPKKKKLYLTKISQWRWFIVSRSGHWERMELGHLLSPWYHPLRQFYLKNIADQHDEERDGDQEEWKKKECHKRIRLCLNKNLDKTFSLRKDLSLTLHKQVSDGIGTRARCVYCSWLYNQFDTSKRWEWSKVEQ